MRIAPRGDAHAEEDRPAEAPDRQFLRPRQAGIEAVAQRDLQAGDGDRDEHEPNADRLEDPVDDQRKAGRPSVRRRRVEGGVHVGRDPHAAILAERPDLLDHLGRRRALRPELLVDQSGKLSPS